MRDTDHSQLRAMFPREGALTPVLSAEFTDTGALRIETADGIAYFASSDPYGFVTISVYPKTLPTDFHRDDTAEWYPF